MPKTMAKNMIERGDKNSAGIHFSHWLQFLVAEAVQIGLEQFPIFFGQGAERINHLLFLVGKSDLRFRGCLKFKKLRQGHAEPIADFFQGGDGWTCLPVKNIAQIGVGNAGFFCQAVQRPVLPFA